MDSRKKKVLTILCLGSFFLAWRAYVLIAEYVIPTKTHAEAAVPTVLPAAPPGNLAVQAAAVLAANVLQQQAAIAQQPWGRDPFAVVPEARAQHAAPESAPQKHEERPAAPALKFTGVSRSDGKWLAVVGNKIVRVGDELEGGFKVVEIGKRSLTLAVGKWAFQYELGVDQPVTRVFGEEP